MHQDIIHVNISIISLPIWHEIGVLWPQTDCWISCSFIQITWATTSSTSWAWIYAMCDLTDSFLRIYLQSRYESRSLSEEERMKHAFNHMSVIIMHLGLPQDEAASGCIGVPWHKVEETWNWNGSSFSSLLLSTTLTTWSSPHGIASTTIAMTATI